MQDSAVGRATSDQDGPYGGVGRGCGESVTSHAVTPGGRYCGGNRRNSQKATGADHPLPGCDRGAHDNSTVDMAYLTYNSAMQIVRQCDPKRQIIQQRGRDGKVGRVRR